MECLICKEDVDSSIGGIIAHLTKHHGYSNNLIIEVLFEEIEKLKAELSVLRAVVYGNKRPGS